MTKMLIICGWVEAQLMREQDMGGRMKRGFCAKNRKVVVCLGGCLRLRYLYSKTKDQSTFILTTNGKLGLPPNTSVLHPCDKSIS
uniref:Uncharacterized protein n=1 Tax=Arion vulgaris TaxID=1028688 RepID=A0A0B7BKD0_9EUPU